MAILQVGFIEVVCRDIETIEIVRREQEKMKQKREKVSQCRGINQEVLNSSPKQMIYIFERLLSTRKKRDEQQENMAKKKKSI